MASSGVAEHQEARWRQQQMNKKASWLLNMSKIQTEDLKEQLKEYHKQQEASKGSYEHELTMRGRAGMDADSVDRKRREGVHRSQLVEYTAKIPNRYNSINYAQQW